METRTAQDGAFDRLLIWLDPNRERAGEQYEALRRKLLIFFHGRQCGPVAEVLTDQTFAVVERKFASGENFVAPHPGAYLYGVAKHIALEYRRRPVEAKLPLDVPAPELTLEKKHEARLSCLDECLAALPLESRLMIEEYYQSTGQHKINRRRHLAERLQVAPGALSVRAHRIRAKLEGCMERCLRAAESK